MSRRISFSEARKEFGLGKTRLYEWIKKGRIRYSVFSSDKRAKKFLRYEDIENLMKEHEYGGDRL